ncbi:MAG: hypothetical protein ABSF23_18445 [Terracidiphilus sp.]|jgi:hypothetical protein
MIAKAPGIDPGPDQLAEALLKSSAIFLSLLPAKGRARESYNWAVYEEFSS